MLRDLNRFNGQIVQNLLNRDSLSHAPKIYSLWSQGSPFWKHSVLFHMYTLAPAGIPIKKIHNWSKLIKSAFRKPQPYYSSSVRRTVL